MYLWSFRMLSFQQVKILLQLSVVKINFLNSNHFFTQGDTHVYSIQKYMFILDFSTLTLTTPVPRSNSRLVCVEQLEIAGNHARFRRRWLVAWWFWLPTQRMVDDTIPITMQSATRKVQRSSWKNSNKCGEISLST